MFRKSYVRSRRSAVALWLWGVRQEVLDWRSAETAPVFRSLSSGIVFCFEFALLKAVFFLVFLATWLCTSLRFYVFCHESLRSVPFSWGKKSASLCSVLCPVLLFFKISPQAGGSDVERTKKKRRGDRYSVQTSLIVAALKKMLPIGLNMCSPADHELINLAKFRYSLVQSPQKPDSSPVVMFLCVPSVCRMRSVSVTVYCSVSALPTICVLLLCVKPAL